MSDQQTLIACPVCHSELTIAQLFMSEEAQRTFLRMVELGSELGSHLAAYLALHKPAKSRLTLGKQLKLFQQVLADVERGCFVRAGREWEAPPALWVAAIQELVETAAAGQVELPLVGHGYLHAVMQRRVERREARLEAEREHIRRTGPRPATTSGPQSMADLVPAPAPAEPPKPRTLPQQSTGTSPMVRRLREENARRQLKGENHE